MQKQFERTISNLCNCDKLNIIILNKNLTFYISLSKNWKNTGKRRKR